MRRRIYLIRPKLQRMGCTVETAENGQKALEMILEDDAGSSDRFGIVFLDNQMVRPFASCFLPGILTLPFRLMFAARSQRC